jgi:hypothetical protein
MLPREIQAKSAADGFEDAETFGHDLAANPISFDDRDPKLFHGL